MSLKFSKRGQLAPDSPIRKLTPYAEEAKKRGVEVFHLNIGQPDFKIPNQIVKSLKQQIDLDYLPYTNSKGNKELLKNWSKYFFSVEIPLLPEDLIITSGASEALILAIAAICDPDDEILVFEPFYANYLGFANLVSAKIVPVSLDSKNGYHLPNKKEILSNISTKTRAILFANPNNPTGTVFSKKELEIILNIAKENNLFIISDETYFGLVFDGLQSSSMLHVTNKNDAQRVIIIDSLSKRLNVCGARIGVLGSTNKDIMSVILRFAQERLAVGTLDQLIVANALKNCLGYINKIAKEYENRRNAFISTLEKELALKIHYPEGAFYAMIELPIPDADDFAKWLLTDFNYQNKTVMVAPGSGFYASNNGKSTIRVAYVLKEKELQEAAKILAFGLKEYIRTHS